MLGIAIRTPYTMSTDDTLLYDSIYRVQVDYDTNAVEVTCIGMDCVDSALEGMYSSVDDLPYWFVGRLAVLSICGTDPPTLLIEGVGRRIDEYTYWVYGEDAGEDKN